MIPAYLRYPAAVAGALLVGWVLPAGGTPHGGLSLLPPLLAIAVAIVTGRLVLGLVTALLGAALLVVPDGHGMFGGGVWIVQTAAIDFVWKPLSDSFQLYILAFTASLIGMVRVISLAGGTRGIAEALARRADGATTARRATFLLGLAVFFDDYSNTIVVGTTMRPVCDRFLVPREKLAYIVDSTAAPVAGVALVSTWIGYEVGLFQDAMDHLATGLSGYELFFRALTLRFYCWFALVFVAANVWFRRDFGPMLRAEQRAHDHGQVLRPGAQAMDGRETDGLEMPEGIRPDWRWAALPVWLVITGVVVGMQLDAGSHPDVISAREQLSMWSQLYWSTVFSNADGAKVMFLSAMVGTLTALLIAVTRRREADGVRPISLRLACSTWLGGVTGFHRALVILVLAWAIKEACSAVGTSDYLVALLGSSLPPIWVPLLVFLLSAAVAFAIGTSWTTMAILLPTTVPLAHELGGLPLTVMTAAAVLDGSIFGDHCSPISDTTVLSSVAAGCDHLDHVKTQIPYAVATMAIAATVGYLGTASLYSGVVGLALGTICIVLLVRFAGQRVDGQTGHGAASGSVTDA
ncbi:MAG: Na+/H+ antiporter NhaC family protein [Gemmatimonadetes bacterium]|jgi:Na+/H+ antiporter NhaC|nr:Na+/H+ antiporter NhaC family protein [Gemmatimonadota bacterium]MBT6148031.1 Na+/H+ antiporter NhaC family protein [Gemmatimonadota bacterium]MBT7863742.1 Na+/H+ antiporter NhaC family protein [Gemmatimonadota bacterium]